MASKVLLVEDDNNLREIYQARLQAEGYDIVSAKDGEEALVIAKQEQPDLIISDVMMPRVSGFEMLDILRNTEGLKDPKVIMLTALGQADDKNRANQLGADRYLVKSQVTLEDIVKAAQDLLSGDPGETPVAVVTESTTGSTNHIADDSAASNDDNTAIVDTPVVTPPAEPPSAPDPQPEPESEPAEPPAPASSTEPVAEAPIDDSAAPAPTTPGTEPVVTEAVEADPNEKDPNDQLIADALKDLTSATTDKEEQASTPPEDEPAPAEPPSAPDPQPEPESEPAEPPAPASSTEPVAEAPIDTTGDSSPVAHKKIIQPLDTPADSAQPNLNDLLAKEEAKSNAASMSAAAPAPTVPASDIHPAAPAHEPGHVFSPSQGAPAPESSAPPASPEQPSAPAADNDPANIAL